MSSVDQPITYRALTDFGHWPKCRRCSEALGRPYPVEHFGVLAREPAQSLGAAHILVIEVKCSHGEARRIALQKSLGITKRVDVGGLGVAPNYGHDQTQRIRLESSRAWGPATEQLACSKVWAFAPGPPGRHGVEYRPGAASTGHRLESNVR